MALNDAHLQELDDGAKAIIIDTGTEVPTQVPVVKLQFMSDKEFNSLPQATEDELKEEVDQSELPEWLRSS